MKKIVLVLYIFSFCGKLLAQPQITSISPNIGNIGSTLVTTISGVNDVFLNGSPCGIKLYRNYEYHIHGRNNVVINNNQMLTTFHIPNNVSVFSQPYFKLSVTDTTGGGNDGYYPQAPGFFTFVDTLPHVTGFVFLDGNNNGIKDVNEPGVANAKVSLLPDSNYQYTDAYGAYHFTSLPGNHTIAWDSIPGQPYVLAPGNVPSYNVTLVQSTVVNNLNFGLNTNYPDYTCSVNLYAPFPRCNNTVTYSLIYQNLSNNIFNGNVVFVLDTGETYQAATPAPALINGDTLIWNYSSLAPYIYNYIHVSVLLPGGGNDVTNTATINALNGATVEYTESKTATQTILCSFDPNDKAVNPPGEQNQNFTLFNIPLEYTIRFQNTGNDTAFNVSIRDFLDSDLDWNTLEVIGSSHPMQTIIDNAGQITFTFNNILLPDSNVNEPGSHGYLRYRIHHKPGLAENTPITNTAYIYFDQNPPVVTNTTLNTLVTIIPVSVNEIDRGDVDVKVAPNPTAGEINFFFKNSDAKLYYLSITSATGLLIGSDYTQTGHFVFKKNNLPSGIYFYKITDKKKTTYSGKLIVK